MSLPTKSIRPIKGLDGSWALNGKTISGGDWLQPLACSTSLVARHATSLAITYIAVIALGSK